MLIATLGLASGPTPAWEELPLHNLLARNTRQVLFEGEALSARVPFVMRIIGPFLELRLLASHLMDGTLPLGEIATPADPVKNIDPSLVLQEVLQTTGAFLMLPITAPFNLVAASFVHLARRYPNSLFRRLLISWAPWLWEDFYPFSKRSLDPTDTLNYFRRVILPGQRIISIGPGPALENREGAVSLETIPSEQGARHFLFEPYWGYRLQWVNYKRRLQRSNLFIVPGPRSAFESAKLNPNSVDGVIILSVWSSWFITNRVKRRMARNLAYSLKPGSLFVLGWYRKGFAEWPKTALQLRYLKLLIAKKGLKLVQEENGFTHRDPNKHSEGGHVWISYRVEPLTIPFRLLESST